MPRAGLPAAVRLGIRRRWRHGVKTALAALGAVWLITEVGTFVSPDLKSFLEHHNFWYGTAVCLIALCAFFWSVIELRSIQFLVPSTGSKILIKFGDLFAEQDHLAFGINEYFDGAIGQRVSIESIHGQFIQKVYSGDENRFRNAIDQALVGKPGVQVVRSPPPDLAYPMGTTAVLDVGNRKAFLFVLTRTDLVTAKASTDVPSYWQALTGALEAIYHHSNHRPVAFPLIGNGPSSLNLPAQHLLRLLTLKLVHFGRDKGLPSQVTIVLPPACFEHVDLREIERDWKS